MISIVCIYNNERVLQEDLLDSLESQTAEYELIMLDNTQGDYRSPSEALNRGGAKAKGRYIMFVHQDVHLCSNSWLDTTERLLDAIPRLGIAGTAGARKSETPRRVETVTNIKQGIPPVNVSPFTVPLQKPVKVQTLDESLVIIPSSVFELLHFDEEVCDDWYLAYAIDYSLSVARLGFDVYVIPSLIHHRSIGKYNQERRQVILHGGLFPARYYRTLGKLLTKHRNYTKYVYATPGWWNTSYPLTLRRAKEVLIAVYYEVRLTLGTNRFLYKPRRALERILATVKRPPHFQAQKLDRAQLAAMYLQGEGIQVGRLEDTLEVPPAARIRHVGLSKDGLGQEHHSLDELSSVANNSQDFVIATGVLEHLENPIVGVQNMLRIVRRCGVVYMSVPDKRYASDVDHPLTSPENPCRVRNGQSGGLRNVDLQERIRLMAKEEERKELKSRTDNQEIMEVMELLHAVRSWLKLPFHIEAVHCVGSEVIVILRKGPLQVA